MVAQVILLRSKMPLDTEQILLNRQYLLVRLWAHFISLHASPDLTMQNVVKRSNGSNTFNLHIECGTYAGTYKYLLPILGLRQYFRSKKKVKPLTQSFVVIYESFGPTNSLVRRISVLPTCKNHMAKRIISQPSDICQFRTQAS